MKFLCLCYYETAQWASMTPEDRQKLAEICAPHDKALKESGHLDLVGSLGMPEQSKTLVAAGKTAKLKNGPFSASKQPIGAFFLIDAADMDEAVKIAGMHPAAHIGHLFSGGIEIRPVGHFEGVEKRQVGLDDARR